MIICKGISVQKGIAIGKIYVHKKKEVKIIHQKIQHIEEEISRLDTALTSAVEQLDYLYETSLNKISAEDALIFDIHKMMILDEDFQNDMREFIIAESMNAEYAVETTGIKYRSMFSAMEDEYMQARTQDVGDITDRIIRILMGEVEAEICSDEPMIVIADDLSPSETITMDKSKVLGFVIKKGSENSHTAILARSMNLPSLVQTDITDHDINPGQTAIIDGYEGCFILNPDIETLRQMETRKISWEEEQKELQLLRNLKDITRDGRKINVFANIGSVDDIDKVLESGATGIGLFRTEFIYMGRSTYPCEEDQYQIYKEILTRMKGNKVIIRTLDIGADKKVDYFQLPEEENPALGYRAIRICLDRPEIFKTQLRAIYRASIHGNVGIMFPMIIAMDEVLAIKEILEQVKMDLIDENISIGKVEIGIMVETPAAALISDELSKEVDFLSLGTNDLTQYTLAIDRQNQKLASICDTHHPAIMKLIQITIENAHQSGAWVGICGELAGDISMTETFLQMGVDELSVSPSKVLELRKKIRSI